ncbi:MAG TPA: hypothetical protein VLN45_04425, partial [Ignavibacteriaceae bacterium]|nr:hypothetical protein [Ignavibacteriaceae bacterium]
MLLNFEDIEKYYDITTIKILNSEIRVFHPKTEKIFSSTLFGNVLSIRHNLSSDQLRTLDRIMAFYKFYTITKTGYQKNSQQKYSQKFDKNTLASYSEIYPQFRIHPVNKNNYKKTKEIFNNLLNQTDISFNNPRELLTDKLFKKNESSDSLVKLPFFFDIIRRMESLASFLQNNKIKDTDLHKYYKIIKEKLKPQDFSEEVRKRKPIVDEILKKIDFLQDEYKNEIILNESFSFSDQIMEEVKELNIVNTLKKRNLWGLSHHILKDKKLKNKFSGFITTFILSQLIDYSKIKPNFTEPSVINNAEIILNQLINEIDGAFSKGFKKKIDFLYDEMLNILISLNKVKKKNFQSKLAEWLSEIDTYIAAKDYFTKIMG